MATVLPGVLAGIITVLIGAVLTYLTAKQTLRAAATQKDVDLRAAAIQKDVETAKSLLEKRVDELRGERDLADAKVVGLEIAMRATSDDCKTRLDVQAAQILSLETTLAAKIAALEAVFKTIQIKDAEIAALTATNARMAEQQATLLFEQRYAALQHVATPAVAPAPAAAPAPIPAPSVIVEPPETQVVLQVTPAVLTAEPETPMVVQAPPKGGVGGPHA